MGILIWLEKPGHEWMEWKYLQTIHWILTKRWYIVQGGMGKEGLAEWMAIMNLLEMDKKARRELFLLLQSGYVGRVLANKLMWEILTTLAIEPPYYDISCKVTQLVNRMREQHLDRPPRDHKDLKWWDWHYYLGVRKIDERWAPENVPQGTWFMVVGEDGTPLEPPYCWGKAKPGHANAGHANDWQDCC